MQNTTLQIRKSTFLKIENNENFPLSFQESNMSDLFGTNLARQISDLCHTSVKILKQVSPIFICYTEWGAN